MSQYTHSQLWQRLKKVTERFRQKQRGSYKGIKGKIKQERGREREREKEREKERGREKEREIERERRERERNAEKMGGGGEGRKQAYGKRKVKINKKQSVLKHY